MLRDTDTEKRYVRTTWLRSWLRERTAPGEPDQIIRALERTGWSKPGHEGRIKATRPGFPETLQWSFLIVPADWESTA